MDSTSQIRSDYIEWDDYFMAVAFLAAKRSKDPRTQVGACIVNEDKKIVSVGYNGLWIGCDDDFHAEFNAVLHAVTNLKNCTLYVASFPCNECAKAIIPSRIKEIIYLSDKQAHTPEVIASKRMLDAAGVKYRQYKLKHERIVIDFSDFVSENTE